MFGNLIFLFFTRNFSPFVNNDYLIYLQSSNRLLDKIVKIEYVASKTYKN